ncbi:MAG: hypothetical protein A2076_01770 [Geobacteraceae bacterium GWC2_53_11]|nr:MAG: hypothetical protein A2076_01770 [Geobacteraceae bacterium GWC2_53_11]
MGSIQLIAALFFLIVMSSQVVSAAGATCSYSRSVQKQGVTFDITSRPASGCAVQIITVGARKGGKKLAGVKADVDYLVQSAKPVDLTGDGVPELLVTSRTTGGIVSEALDVYVVDGAGLRRVTVPELDDKSGYRGGDRFHFEERLIVRTVPVYRDGDPDTRPAGGTRSLKYEFRDGAFSLYVQMENASNIPAAVNAQSIAVSSPAPQPAEKQEAAATGRSVTEVVAGDSGIEIRTNGAVAKYRTVRLDKPERIAIDIPGADSTLAGKKIHLDRYGISTVRVGRNKGFLRVVFDTSLAKFPKFEVKSSDAGVLVEFPQ